MLRTSDQTRVFHRSLRASYPTVTGGDGVWLIDADGRRYLDGSGGAAVAALGHGHKEVIDAIKAQLDAIAFAHTGSFTNEAAEELAAFLTDRAPQGISRAYLVSGGSEAVEAAMKLVRQYHMGRGDPGRMYYIARWRSYHGNTLGALALGGNLVRRKPYEDILPGKISHIAPCFAYRNKMQGETDIEYGLRSAHDLEVEILRIGPERVAAFFAETVVGATAGAVAPAPGYFKEIRRICDKYGILLILDEVMCGMGRTGTLFACEQDDVVPDMITIAKALGGGYQPIGGLLVQNKIVDVVRKATGLFQHGHTYMGHAAAAAGALAVQKIIERDGLLAQVRQKGARLMGMLKAKFADHPHVGDIRGRGLFIGVELVQDRTSKETFSPEDKLNHLIKQTAFNNNLLIYPGGGTADGIRGDHILLAPPFIIDNEGLELLVDKLALSLDEAIAQVNARAV